MNANQAPFRFFLEAKAPPTALGIEDDCDG
jgi:hypothetical protein